MSEIKNIHKAIMSQLWPEYKHQFYIDVYGKPDGNPSKIHRAILLSKKWTWINVYSQDNYYLYFRLVDPMLILFKDDKCISVGFEYVINEDHTKIFALGKDCEDIFIYGIGEVIDALPIKWG